jgi:hypothetical protein
MERELKFLVMHSAVHFEAVISCRRREGVWWTGVASQRGGCTGAGRLKGARGCINTYTMTALVPTAIHEAKVWVPCLRPLFGPSCFSPLQLMAGCS